ncbi:DUF504 domain-containing protein [Candidatus Woesearchaeota archaeon]|nr:DUF504 domain-containing protein [Candidatus Woesearchaeota archaeon]
MQPIIDLINKIKWDKKENPEDYSLFYSDRFMDEFKEIKFTEIKRTEDSFLVIEREGEEVYIPTHRIHYVKKKGVIVWKR